MATRRASKPASKERAPSPAATAAEIADVDPRERLAELYSVALPDELLEVWELARSIRPSRPLAAFADALGLTLRGPFEHLAERDRQAPRKRLAMPHLQHRAPLDPPEFVVLASAAEGGARLGYYFDDPGRRAPLVCRQGDAPQRLEILGESLLLALRAELERRLVDAQGRGPGRGELQRLDQLRAELATTPPQPREEIGAAYLEAYVDRARSPRRPLTPTADGVGLLAPRRLYRPLGASPACLRQETRASDPRHLVELGEAALSDGFPATALLIGKELWACGLREPHRVHAAELLSAAYRALKRPLLAKITEAHSAERCAPQLSVAPVDDDPPAAPTAPADPSLSPGSVDPVESQPRLDTPHARRHPTWRIAALRSHDPAAIYLTAMTTAEIEALTAAPWDTVTRLSFSVAPDQGYLSALAPILRGETMPALRHLTLLGGEYPRDFLPALVESPLFADQLDTFDLHPDSLSGEERELLIERWRGREELQLFPSAIALRDHVASYNLGVIARDLGYHLRALDLFERSIALGGDHWDYGEKGVALLELGDYDNAIAAFHMAIRSDEGHLIAWLNLAEAHRRSDDLDNALRALDRGAEIATGKKDQLSVLGLRTRVCLCAGDEPAAEALAAELDPRAADLLRHRPNDAALHYWRAAARLLLGDRDGALRCLGEAISREPQQRIDALHDELFADVRDDLEDLSFLRQIPPRPESPKR